MAASVMIGAGGASRRLPREGAIREGFGVPVIAPGSVRWVVCNLVPIDRVIAFSCVQGWVLARMSNKSRAELIRFEGRVEVA